MESLERIYKRQLFVFVIPVFVIKSKYGWVYEGIDGATFLFGGASCAACTVYESTDTAHLQQFVLFGVCNVGVDSGKQFGTHALLDTVEYLEGVGYGSLLDAYHIAALDDK